MSRGGVAEVETAGRGRPPAPQRCDLPVAQAAVLQARLRYGCESYDDGPSATRERTCRVAASGATASNVPPRNASTRRGGALAAASGCAARLETECGAGVVHHLHGNAGGRQQPDGGGRKVRGVVHPERGGVRSPLRRNSVASGAERRNRQRPSGELRSSRRQHPQRRAGSAEPDDETSGRAERGARPRGATADGSWRSVLRVLAVSAKTRSRARSSATCGRSGD